MSKSPHNAASAKASLRHSGQEAEHLSASSEVAKREEEILGFWKEKSIFERSLEKESPQDGGEEFVFYDGPPFATGLPHYGHLLAGTIKDVIPRYQTMRGKRVRRQWGWDVHGLPIENLIEKKLGLSNKRDILTYGIEKFNEEARDSVLEFRDDWREIIPRTGRWADMENDYKTMDPAYSETTWWIFRSLWDKDLVYEGFKSMHLCPRCETTLSNFEVNQGYKDIKDFAVTTRFELADESQKNEKTYLLTWTTTPWTLPGNMAVGVHPETEYVKVAHEGELYIVAKEALERVFGEARVEVVETYKGSDLIGLSYVPPFPYYRDKEFDNKENAWKVYGADYVTTDDGTGIVHLAPAFGEEDLELALAENIPVVHHVATDGAFVEAVTDFAGQKVKPKDEEGDEHMATDIDIIKWLAHNDKLFAKEKITHSYPHCWRCDTPLLNYASASWFIAVTKIKDEILSENEKVHWTPARVGSGRFGKWIEGARDWAMSRSRFWGSPLPVWRSADGSEVEVIGSLGELREKSRDQLTEVVLMRHAESEKNVADVFDVSIDTYGLTKRGVEQAREAAKQLEGVDVIYTSPVLRAKHTAEIIGKVLGIEVRVADEVTEINSGQWDGEKREVVDAQKDRKDYLALPPEEQFSARRGDTGESWEDLEARAWDLMERVAREHKGGRVLIITHQGVVVSLQRLIEGRSHQELDTLFARQSDGAYTRPFNYTFFAESGKPFDFHRPYIDEVKLYSEKGTALTRVPEVFDTWYESGSMPYGQYHYPFENKDLFDPQERKGFPADFIAEGLDQTRGWFYSLIVLGVGLFGVSPYKNVIVNGIVLAEDGQKMSKRLKNYPDPLEVINKYGADSLRLYLLASPVVRGEDLNFSEKGVAEVMRKVIVRLDNVRSFYDLYRDASLEETASLKGSENVLDIWIASRLAETEEQIRESLESYALDRATRPLFDFVEDLSTWYLRRSRERFKSEAVDKEVHQTLYAVLKGFSKLLAPFTPFYADYLYSTLRNDGEVESVHLATWPTLPGADKAVLDTMATTREIVSEGLEARSRDGFKVRQPLQSLTYGGDKLSESYEDIILDEVNVKEVLHSKTQGEVVLDTEITEKLKKEGIARDITRTVQDMRKRQGLNPRDRILLTVSADQEGQRVVKDFESDIAPVVSAERITVADLEGDSEAVEIGGLSFSFEIDRV